MFDWEDEVPGVWPLRYVELDISVYSLNIMKHFSPYISSFFQLISPRFCPICGSSLAPTEQKVCTVCLAQLPYIHYDDFLDNEAARLFWAKIPIERAACWMTYSNDSKSHQLLMQIKYGHRPDIALWMGEMLARELIGRGFFDTIDGIIPIPLHWRRKFKRGYNQSNEIARGVACVTGLPILKNVVVRYRNNETQTHKTADERRENVKNIFKARAKVPNQHLLLVDDVLTTGATLTACAHAIMKQNPGVRFSILTLAKPKY